MSLLNKAYLEELVSETISNTDFDGYDSMGEMVAHAEWEVDKALAREFAFLAEDDDSDPPARYFTMAENVREEYDIDVDSYVQEVYDEVEYRREVQLARFGL